MCIAWVDGPDNIDRDRVQRVISPLTHDYPVWYASAKSAFEKAFADYMTGLFCPPQLHAVVYDATNPGRRIRPILYYALWRSREGEYPKGPDVLPAVAVELFHAASIIVDDISDQELRRRDKMALYRLYDLDTAILTSHYLVAAGYDALLGHARGAELSAAWTKSYRSIVIGQCFDLRRDFSIPVTEQHLRSLEKTISFFSFIGRILNICTGDSRRDVVKSLERMGECFQISNDVIDLIFFESELRHEDTADYRLSPSYLIPLLVDSGSVKPVEVLSRLPFNRHIEISRAAQNLVPSAVMFLRNLFQPICDDLAQTQLPRDFQNIAVEFIKETTKPSFWLHHHAK